MESDMFKHIWDRSAHYSFISGIPIRVPTPANFAHVLSKAVNRYPHFRLNPANIVLVTQEEHTLIDHGTDKLREAYCRRITTASFNPFYKKEAELKKLYESMYKDLTDSDY